MCERKYNSEWNVVCVSRLYVAIVFHQSIECKEGKRQIGLRREANRNDKSNSWTGRKVSLERTYAQWCCPIGWQTRRS